MYSQNWRRVVIALLLFGTAFGYLEAAIVSYLRALHEPAVQRFYPGRASGDLFPLLTLEQLRSAAPQQMKILAIELGREAATIAMLAAIAMAIARNAGQWAAAFVIAFGAWDITFYIFLKALLDWPASLWTWDILFLVPVPWVGPVLAPVLVSIAMVGAGMWHFGREAHANPVRIGIGNWVGIVTGALVIVLAFAMDYRQILSGQIPSQFHWGVFLIGLTMGVASYIYAAVREAPGTPKKGACRAESVPVR